jgi:defect-in-organelle-trafficking protein DotB
MVLKPDPYKYAIDLPGRISDGDTINDLLQNMENLGGSDLFIIGGREAIISLHGRKVFCTKRKISNKEAELIIESIYGNNAISKLGEAEPLNPSHEFKSIISQEGEPKRTMRHRFRCNAISCLRLGRKSMTITLRTIPTTPPSVLDMQVEAEILEACRKSDQGLILVVGATGNGKSTLLASILRDQLEEEDGHRNLVTIEHPIEFVYDDIEQGTSFCTQMEVGKHIKSFSDGVVNALRMAPTTILVGEARNYEEITAALEASVTGHVVFSTVHANSVAETFQRMVATFPEELQHQGKSDLIQALKCVVAQRLLPTIDGKRTAIREFLVLTQEIKEYLMSADNLALAANEAVRKYGKPMMRDVEDKFNKNIISEEVYNKQKMNYQE